MKEDGGFPDLTDYCLKRLKVLDPKFKTEADFNNYTPAEERAANDDVLDFLNDMNKADSQLRRSHEASQAIFESGKENSSEDLNQGYAGQYNKKRQAEDERLKGNEFMKSKDY